MLRTTYITIIIALLLPASLFAQTKKESGELKAARKEYQALRYAPAAKLLESDLKKDPNNVEAQEMIANSYRNIKDYDKALMWYAKLTQAQTLKPEWALYYAETLANEQQYTASEQWYQKYLELTSKDNRASAFVKTYPEVNGFLKNRRDWTISYLNINTAASEYSPMYYKKGLMFSSNRKTGVLVKKVFGWDQTPFSDLYYVNTLAEIKGVNIDSIRKVIRKDLKGNTKKMYKVNDDDTPPTSNDTRTVGNYSQKFLRDTIGDYLAARVKVEPVPGNINTQYHEGSTALLPDGSLMFTRNNYFKGKYAESKDGINKLKLFTAKAPTWEVIEPFPYNDDQYSIGHPALNKAGTLLIFASDMKGGYGGTDLYYSKRNSIHDAWGKPVNMGPVINTEGNEQFPTLYKDNILYFSSTGHPGLGGLDVFQIALNDTEPVGSPVNLGSPINSSVDDFGLIRNENGITGYFTSNRKGSDDIYSFVHHDFQIKLHVEVVDSITLEPVCYSAIQLSPNGLKDLDADMQCSFSSVLKPETVYYVTATNDGYSSASKAFNTNGINADTTINITLKVKAIDNSFYKPREHKPGFVFNCDSLKRELTVNKIYYDLDKSNIRPDAQREMENVLKILTDHPDLKILVASYCDSRESKAYNMALSYRRSESAKDYLVAHGIDASRVFTEHYGENNLVSDCPDGVPCTEAQQQLNRRSEFFLIKRGKRVLTMDCDWLEGQFGR
ncbi:OmpA family protein [Mucilaginibacter agri]|uniref:OmpA family protein n=1 Tax=Mucilaginibacter agri TaxID=2695265 RepID=A0A965ZI49_9SPHI|nr:OmpA family protein [Mucilaginibacter agri]NCD71135.1 OmpA family protein [Mucilaginibacter agri]